MIGLTGIDWYKIKRMAEAIEAQDFAGDFEQRASAKRAKEPKKTLDRRRTDRPAEICYWTPSKTAGCDSRTEIMIEDTLRDMGCTIIVVTHSQEQLNRFYTHLIDLD